MNKNFFRILIFISVLSGSLFAQDEMIVDLQSNPVVAKKWAQMKEYYAKTKLKQSALAPLTLPFKDDFSKEGVYPDSSKWVDKAVFINRTYPIAPISIGVATFDGIDSTGYPYNFAAGTNSSAIADYLSSQPINLGAPVTPGDSLYFSFYYQSTGRGNSPETKDSLVLEFKRCYFDVTTQTTICNWDWIWARKGYIPANKDSNFHYVLIPIKDPAYFTNDFQFRFKNYATLSGNVDHWHVDYVYLDAQRNYLDTVLNDVAFVYEPKSILKRYQSMPWEQFKQADCKDSISTLIRNNGNLVANTTYNYTVDSAGILVNSFSSTGASDNVNPYATSGYYRNIPLRDTLVSLSDTTVFTYTSYIKTNVNDYKFNDTVRYYQEFYNYYAYDDGTAEAGYILNSQTANAKFAMRFTLNVKDTLRAMQLFFNPIITNASTYTFRMAVWSDNGGVPGTLMYKDSVMYPDYSKTGYNQFQTYRLSNPGYILAAGTYHFGFIEIMAAETLNIGFDLNTNAAAYTMTNTSGTWQQQNTNPKGTVMFRPVFGKALKSLVGVQSVHAPQLDFDIFPNPATDKLNINFNDEMKSGNIQLSLTDTYGKLVWSESNFTSSSIDVSQFAAGLYFIRVADKNSESIVKRIVIVH